MESDARFPKTLWVARCLSWGCLCLLGIPLCSGVVVVVVVAGVIVVEEEEVVVVTVVAVVVVVVIIEAVQAQYKLDFGKQCSLSNVFFLIPSPSEPTGI